MSRQPVPWSIGARSETGYVRSANEDRMGWRRAPFGDVIVTADGMGGYRGGALAAEIAVQTLLDLLSQANPQSSQVKDQIQQAFKAANQAVFQRRNPADPETREMGATSVSVITHGSQAMIGHVGDSRAYLWQPEKGLKRLMRDHTRVQTMLDAGLLTPAEAAVHPDASMLDRAMGHQPTVEADVSDWIQLNQGDALLLCSDGLCGYASDSEIAKVLEAGGEPQAMTDRLIDLALSKGGEDNVTVQFIRYGKDPTMSMSKQLGISLATVVLCSAVSAGVSFYLTQKALKAPTPAVVQPTPLERDLAKVSNDIKGIDQRLNNLAVRVDAAASEVASLKAPAKPAAKLDPKKKTDGEPPAVTPPATAQTGANANANAPNATQAAGSGATTPPPPQTGVPAND